MGKLSSTYLCVLFHNPLHITTFEKKSSYSCLRSVRNIQWESRRHFYRELNTENHRNPWFWFTDIVAQGVQASKDVHDPPKTSQFYMAIQLHLEQRYTTIIDSKTIISKTYMCFFSFMLDFQGVYLWNRFGNGNSLYLRCLHLEPRMTHWAICNDLTSTYSSNSGNQSRNLQRINSSQKRFMGGTVIPLVPILASLECENFRHCILGINYGQWMASHHCEGCMPKIHPSMVFLREASRKKKHKNQHMFVSNRCFPQQFFNDFLTKIC